MIERVRYWSLVLLAWVVVATTWSRQAAAQSLAMSKDYPVIRVNDDTGRSVSSSTDQTVALTITGADCRSSKLKFRFSLTVTGYDTSQTLQAWVTRSTDCASEFTSASTVTRTCWRVHSNIDVKNGVATVELPADLLLGIDAEPAFAGNQRVLTNSCDENPANSGKGRQSFNVYFLLTNSENKVAANTTQRMYYSLVGPDAPAINDIFSADEALGLKWSPLTGSTTEISYEFYCAKNDDVNDAKNCKSTQLEALGSSGPASTSSGGAGGGSSTTSSTDGGASSSESESALVAGAAGVGADGIDGIDDSESSDSIAETVAGAPGNTAGRGKLSSAFCGKISGKMNGSGFTNDTLNNETAYAVALAVRDTYGNLGQLSAYRCEIPRPVKTFYEAYRAEGGQAGGSFCNLGFHANRTTPLLAAGLLGLVASLRRRTRRDQRA